MKRTINNILSVAISLPKFLLIKIFHGKHFRFHWIERFSPNTDIYFIGNSNIILGKKVRQHEQ